MSSYLTFYLVPKRTKTHYKEDGTSEEIEISKGEPLALMSFSRNSSIYRNFYEYLHPTYIGVGSETNYDEVTSDDVKSIIYQVTENLEEDRKSHENKIKVLKDLGTSPDLDTLNQLISEEDILREEEEDLDDLKWLQRLFSEIKYSDFEKILMNID